MPALARRSLAAALALAAAPAFAGCSAKKQTEYVAGITTQVQVPRDLRAIRVSVSVGGFTTFCRSYRAYNGVVQLPRSLGAYALNEPELSGPITYTVIGYSTEIPGDEEFALEGCQGARVGDAADTRIIRRSRQPYVPEKILFLPMPLKYSCFDKTDCDGEDLTCKAGRCVPADTPPETLPEYDPDLVDGRGGACFSVTQCLGAAKPAVLVDPATCTYAIANTPSEPPRLEGAPDVLPGEPQGEGVNVLIAYDGGLNQEVLDKDPDEGFTVPDPAKPQQFRLAPGLCDMVKGVDETTGAATPHRVTAVRASEVCRAKSKFQPICAGDQLALMGGAEVGGSSSSLSPPGCAAQELQPPDATLVVVVDNTKGHEPFFDEAEAQAVKLSLDDPAFARTKLALVYAPGAPRCEAGAPEIALGPSRGVKGQIAQSFAQYAPGTRALELADGPPAFEGALFRAYAAAASAPDDFRRAVLVFGNRDFEPPAEADQCLASPDSPASLAADAKAAEDIDTYVLMLAETPGDAAAADEARAQADALALAGGTTNATDARADDAKGDAVERFQDIVQSLSTCVYDVRAEGAPPADGVLSYLDPLFGQTSVIPPGACGGDGAPGQGWGYGPDPRAGVKRIYLCQDSCAQYRDVLRTASGFNLTFGQPAPAVPIFAHASGCGPTL
ncbi:MAG TPA: hypothetical protein VFS43_28685 [Polyangiaceae bacterium]|nr:hypothetical protein [Polyangiaceae bacterium]